MKLGIVGSGKIVKEVLPRLRGWGWEPEALCGTARSAETVAALAAEYHIPKTFTDYGALLRQKLDAVYLAVPNHLHYEMARQALEAGQNVILEKPFTSNLREAEALAALAEEKGLFLVEAISVLFMPVFQKMRQWLDRLGEIKFASCNYSQYSSRYDRFCQGIIDPAFDVRKSGGALMDLNIYNIHLLMGLLGTPRSVAYHPNMERGVDTSGMLAMEYPGFVASAWAAKDCAGPCRTVIQGTRGYLLMEAPTNVFGPLVFCGNDGTREVFDIQPDFRLEPEFRCFRKLLESGDRNTLRELMEHSLKVIRVVTEARKSCGLVFPADNG